MPSVGARRRSGAQPPARSKLYCMPYDIVGNIVYNSRWQNPAIPPSYLEEVGEYPGSSKSSRTSQIELKIEPKLSNIIHVCLDLRPMYL